MTCFHPLAAMQPVDGGRVRILGAVSDVSKRPKVSGRFSAFHEERYTELDCGQCIGCRLRRACDWGVRGANEAQMHERNCVLTLTYRDEVCPVSLDYRDLQAAFDRMRYHLDKFRWLNCGEYGTLNSRAHFHACVFGVDFDDKQRWSKSANGSQLYRSELLESKIWPHGHVLIGDMSLESAAYVGRYCVDKVTGEDAEEHYERVDWRTGECVSVRPEFVAMSKGRNGVGGIGIPWLKKFHRDIWPVNDGVIVNGTKYPVPRAYDRWCRKHLGLQSDLNTMGRVETARRFEADRTEERLLVREVVRKARLEMAGRR